VLRKTRLAAADLYRRGGAYEYRRGVNVRAVTALVAGIAVALVGLVVPPVRFLYNYGWFVGFGVSFFVYLALMAGEVRGIAD
jgi:nucleobase:cation symporter-1, NCS1 family